MTSDGLGFARANVQIEVLKKGTIALKESLLPTRQSEGLAGIRAIRVGFYQREMDIELSGEEGCGRHQAVETSGGRAKGCGRGRIRVVEGGTRGVGEIFQYAIRLKGDRLRFRKRVLT